MQVTYPNATVEWLNDKEISLQLKTPKERQILSFNLLAYDNVYNSELIGNWIVEIHSLAGF